MRTLFLLVLILLILPKFSVSSDSIKREKQITPVKDTVIWLKWEQIPNFIFHGKFKDQGIADTFMKTLQDGLPQYEHVEISANAARYFEVIKQEKVCVAWAWIVPGSEDIRIYSKPTSLVAPLGIQILKSKQHLFGKPGTTLSLTKLMDSTKLTLGYLNKLTYSKKLHALIDKYRKTPRLYISTGSSRVEFNLEMLDLGRVDCFLGFQQQSTYDAETKGIENRYQYYNIEEMDRYSRMHVHTSNTPFGKTLMKAIEPLLTQKVLYKHLNVIERWQGPNKKFRDIFIDHIINGNANPLVKNPGE